MFKVSKNYFDKGDDQHERGFDLITEANGQSCTNCGRTLRGVAYELRTGDRRPPHCLRCALRYRPMLKRFLVVCVVVGTMLTAINQSNFILSGDF